MLLFEDSILSMQLPTKQADPVMIRIDNNVPYVTITWKNEHHDKVHNMIAEIKKHVEAGATSCGAWECPYCPFRGQYWDIPYRSEEEQERGDFCCLNDIFGAGSATYLKAFMEGVKNYERHNPAY